MIDFFSFENIRTYSRLALAHGFIFILFLLGVISYSVSSPDVVRPYFIVMALYFWSIYRPTLMSPAYVFALGLLFDFILNYPVGLHALIFVALQWIIRDQRLFFLGQPYFIAWIGFAFTCFSVLALEWGFFSLVSNIMFDYELVLWGSLVSILSYPLVTLLFHMIYRILPPVTQSHFV